MRGYAHHAWLPRRLLFAQNAIQYLHSIYVRLWFFPAFSIPSLESVLREQFYNRPRKVLCVCGPRLVRLVMFRKE